MDLEEAEKSEIKLAKSTGIIEKAREYQKNIYLFFCDYAKVFDCVDHSKLLIFLKRLEYQITLSTSWETCMQVRKQQLEQDMEQWTGSNWEKSICQGCLLSSCLFNLYTEYTM